jgi:hypothetical protein
LRPIEFIEFVLRHLAVPIESGQQPLAEPSHALARKLHGSLLLVSLARIGIPLATRNIALRGRERICGFG